MCCSVRRGSSSSGPEGSVSTLVAAAVLPLAAAGSAGAAELAAMLALLVARCFALAWLLRLGWIADYFSRPVLVGYIHGVAVVLIIGQLGKLLGLSIDARDPLPQLWEVVRELGEVSGATVAVAAAALAALFALRRFDAARAGGAVVVVAAIVVSWALDLAGARRRGRRLDPVGPAELERADAAARRHRRRSCRRRSGSSSSRSPTRS